MLDLSAIDEFRMACKAYEPLRISVQRPLHSAPEILTSRYPSGILGRMLDADFYFGHPEISRKHAYIQVVAGRVLCVDLGSRAGLIRNGTAVEWAWLGGDVPLTVGPYQVALPQPDDGKSSNHHSAKPLENPLSASAQRADLPEVTLEILYPGDRLSCWPMRCEMTLVGRASGCRIQLVHESVSRFHCSLLRTPLGLWAVDLVGTGGILVNGAPVRFSKLNVDDELTVGEFRIRPVVVGSTKPGATPHSSRAKPSIPALSLDGRSPPALGEAVGALQQSANTFARAAFSDHELPAATLLEPASFSFALHENAALNGHTPEQIQIVEALLGPLASQFAATQQQLLGQLNLVIESVFRMVTTLQRDQTALVNQELSEIRQLSRELRSLQGAPENGSQPERSETRRCAGESPSTATSGFPIPGRDFVNVAIPIPMGDSSRVEAQGGPMPYQDANPSIPGQTLHSEPLPEAAEESSQASAIHALIWQRIAEVKRERQGRWQKILGVLNGNLQGAVHNL